MQISQYDPIFIIGYARSGTSLLCVMLTAHSNLDCGSETLFRLLARTQIIDLLKAKTWPVKAANCEDDKIRRCTYRSVQRA